TAERGLSVRQVEEAVRSLLEGASGDAGAQASPDLQTRWLQKQIGAELGRKFSIRPARGGGYALNIGFGDLSQLEQALARVLDLIGRVRSTAGPRVRESGQ